MTDSKINSPKTITVCVPTYNRGTRALQLVNKLLESELHGAYFDILVLDNGSEVEVADYNKIRSLADRVPGVKYIRHAKNRMMHGNFLGCFESSNQQYVMIVSDEDIPKADFFIRASKLLQENPTVGIIRGSNVPATPGIATNGPIQSDSAMLAGEDALLRFSLTNNYFSGTVYNRGLFAEYGITDRLKENLDKNAVYPHLYLEILASAVCDVVTTSDVCCTEGVPLESAENDPLKYVVPYSFGSRLDQFVILRDAFVEAVSMIGDSFNLSLFISLYLRLCEKYLYLTTMVNSPLYERNGLNLELLHTTLLPFFKSAISMYSGIEPHLDLINSEIDSLHAKYWRWG